MTTAVLDFTPENVTNSSFGVFVVDSPKEQAIFDKLQQWGQSFIQNDKASLSSLVKMLRAESTEELLADVIAAEKQKLQEQQQLQQQEYQNQQALQKQAQDFQLLLQANELDAKLAIAEMDTFKFVKDQDADDDGIPDQFEIQKFKTEAALKSRDLDLKEKKLQQDKELKLKSIAAKK